MTETRIRPLWLVFFIGGTFLQETGGTATYPGGVLRQTRRWREGQWWKKRRVGWWRYVDPRPSFEGPGVPIHKQSWWRVPKPGDVLWPQN